MTPERTVRHLRVAAPDEAAVHALLPRLEDALRCASLPDAGAQVLLVRRLALGPVAADSSAQALSCLVEQRLAEGLADADAAWADGGTPAADRAGRVRFASALDARRLLAGRIVRGQACAGWYWRLAVPEWRAGDPVALQLRAMALTVAGWPEAAVALPAWAQGVASAGGAAWLAQAFDEAQGAALLRRVGRTAPAPAARRTDAPTPTWLDALLGAQGEPAADALAARADRRARPAGHEAEEVEEADETDEAVASRPPAAARSGHDTPAAAVRPPAPTQTGWPAPRSSAEVPPSPDAASGRIAGQTRTGPPGGTDAPPTAPGGPPPARQAIGTASHPPFRPDAPPLAERGPRTDETPFGDAHGPVTGCAGLLFLLPVLARLGLPDWCARAGLDSGLFTRQVLRGALRRLQAPPDDPAWALAAAAAPAPGRSPEEALLPTAPAPARWADPLLAAPRGCTDRTDPATALARASDAAAQADVWRLAARRWLRRAGGIGLADLVRRRGRLALTRTHVGIHLGLSDADLRVRRLGLDINPGWLPWFGRVVAFHYDLERRP